MTDDLFALAIELTYTRKRKLQRIALRKAVSTAYYGLFHALLTMFANNVAGRGNARAPEYASIYRFPDHALLLRRLLDSADRDIQAVASVLQSLQGERLKADYDPQPFKMGRQAAQELIIEAKEAAMIVKRLNPQQRLAITAALLAPKRR
jgi:hypothetical protein